MVKVASIKKNYIMNTLLTMSSFVFPLITFPYVTRILLPVGTGKVAFAVSLIAYFNLFAQLGVPTYGVRACAQVRDDREQLSKTTHELVIINLITSAISYAGLLCALLFIPRLFEDRTLYILVSATILLNTLGMEWLYKALEQYTYITIRSIVFKAIALIAMFMLIHSRDDYVIYGGITIFAASASNIVNLFYSRKYINWRVIGGYNFKKHMRPIVIFFAMACATTIYTNLDALMLGFMAGDVEVGYYDAAIKIKNVLLSLVTSLGVVVLPRASYYIEKGKINEFWDISSKSINFIFLISCPVLVFSLMFARETIYILAGHAYENSIIPMQILMPTLLLIGLTGIMGIQIMVPLGRERKVLHSVIVGAIVDALLNIALIPKLGASGAAIGTLVAEISVFIYQFIVLKDEIKPAFIKVKYWKIIIAIAFATGISFFSKVMIDNTLLIIAVGAIVFFSVYLILLLVTKEEMTYDLLREISGKIKK